MKQRTYATYPRKIHTFVILLRLHRGGTFSSAAWHLFFNNFHRAGEANVVWFPLNLPEAYFTCESIFWLPDAFADGGGTKGAS